MRTIEALLGCSLILVGCGGRTVAVPLAEPVPTVSIERRMVDALEDHLEHDVTLRAAVITEDERYGYVAYSFARFEAWRTARERDGTWPAIAERAEILERECFEDQDRGIAEAEREVAWARANGYEVPFIEELEEEVAAMEGYRRFCRVHCHPYRGHYEASLAAIESCGSDRVGLAVFVLSSAAPRLLPERGIELDTCGADGRMLTLDAVDLDADGTAEAVFVVELASFFRDHQPEAAPFPFAESITLHVVAPDQGLVLQWDGALNACEAWAAHEYDDDEFAALRSDSHRVRWLAGVRESRPMLRAEIVHGPGRNMPIRCPCAVFERVDVTPYNWLEEVRWTTDYTRSCRTDIDLAALRAEFAQGELRGLTPNMIQLGPAVIAGRVCAELVRESATFVYDRETSEWAREDG